MKFGMNLLLWTGEMNDGMIPVLHLLKSLGYDGVEVMVMAWKPGGSNGTRYCVRSTGDGVEGWLAAVNLRRARTVAPLPPGLPAKSAPVSTANVSPMAACSTYCSDVASATTGTAPSSNVRRSSSQGLARSASVAAIDAANAKRFSSMKLASGAAIVGLVGR